MTSLLAPIEDTPYVGGTANSFITVDVNGLQVTLTGIDGELLTWSSAGVPAVVAAGSSGQVLTSNGAGTAPTFQAAAAAGGIDTQVQYNNGGAFGGMAGVAWDDTANELTITAQAADDVPLAIVPDVSQTANLQTWGTDVARVTSAGDFSNTQGGDRGEAFGEGATVDGSGRQVALGFEAAAAGTESMALGANASSGQGGLAIGSSATAILSGGTALGQNSTSGASGFAFGQNTTTGSQGICIGAGSSATFGVALGDSAKTTANFQFVAGAAGSGGANAINNVYIGQGVVSTTPNNVTHHSSAGSGTNIVGGDYIIAGGESTGNATPSKIILQGTTAGSTGASLQALVDIVTITDGTISASQGFAGTEVFGGGSVNTAGTDNTIIGGGSTNTVGNDNTTIGADSTNVSGSNNTLVGANISVTQTSGVAGSTAIGEGITIDSKGFAVAIGYNITISGGTTGFGGIAIGAGVSIAETGFVIGRNATSTGTDSMVFGDTADGGAAAHILAIGSFASATATDCMTIGFNAKGTHADTFLVGAGAISRGVNQIAFGTDKTSSGGSQYTDMYLGGGARMLTGAESGPGTPSDFTIHATDASDTNITGWKLQVQSGVSTGNATPSKLVLRGTTVGSTGTTPQTVTDVLEITDANTITLADAVNFVLNATTGTKIGTATTQKLGFFNATPIVQPTEITDELTSITHTAPGSPDFAIQDLIDSGVASAFGFATKDEGNTVLSVILNLQARVNELETVLSTLGLVADAD